MSLWKRSICIFIIIITIISNSIAIDLHPVKKNNNASYSKNNFQPYSVLATTNTSASGNWSVSTNWSAGVPTSNEIAGINHSMNLDANIVLTGGGYYTVNSPVTDASGGTAYTLTLSGSSTHGVLDVYSNMTFEGACGVNSKGEIIVRNGATLTLGPTTFANGSFVTVEAGGTLIINGTLTNNNNSNNITINGNVTVNGNFSGGNGSTVVGTGGLTTTGTITNTGGTVFGSGNSCSTGPCSGTNLCNFTNTIAADQSICYSQTPATITGSTIASATYTWQSCTTSATGTYTAAAGTNNGQNYSPGSLTTTTWYRRQVISGSCTSISSPVQISVTNNSVSVSIASSYGGTSICSGSTVIFTATVTNGGTSPSYQWKLNNVNVGSNSPTYTTTTLANNDVVNCVVTSSLSSCTTGNPATSNSLTMTVSGTAPAAPTAIGGSVCGSGSVTFITAGSGGTIRNWYSTSTGGSLIATGSTYTTPSLSTTTTYYVATQSNGGCEGPRTAVVATVNPLPTPSISSSTGSLAMCSGFSIILTSSSYSSYSWSTGATSSSISVSTAGTFTVTVKDANNCQGSASVTTTVNPIPAVPTISASGATTFCSGGSVNLTSSSATSYLWSTGATTQTITANTSGSYTVTIADANGCKRSSSATVVTANPLPATPTISASGSTSICSGSSVTLTSSASTNGYTWSNGIITQSNTVNSAGSYTVTIKDLNNCTATSAPTVVTVNALPATPTITAGGPTTFCSGGSVTLTSSTSSNGYTWSNSATTQATTVNSSGSYTVTVKDVNNCTATSAPTVITVNALPATPTITAGGPTSFCSGGSVTLTSSASTNGYFWSNADITQSITVNTSGSYTVTIKDINNCTATSAPTVVTVNSLPATPTITAGGPTSFCAGGSVTLTSSASTNGYSWSNAATTQATTVNTSGSYTVTVKDLNNCTATSAPTIVTVNALPATPIIMADGPTTFCAGGSVTLTSSASTNGYSWSNAATTQATSVNTSGSYTVTVKDINNCTATSAPTIVTVNVLPATPTITADGPTTFCSGGSVTLTSSASTNGYSWSNAAITQSTTVNTSGSYTVTIKDINNCTATSAPTVVTINALPAIPTISADGSTTFCSGGSVNLTSSISSNGYTWSNSANTQAISVNTSGSYTVTVTDLNNCSATSAPTVVTVNTLPATPTITAGGPTTFCAGNSVNLSSSAGSSYLWSTGETTQSISVSSSGSFSVTITDVNGCNGSSLPTTITVNSLPSTPSITAGGPTSFCSGDSVTLNSSSAYSYLWTTGATTSSIIVKNTGNYSVTISDGNGCQASSTPVTVTITSCNFVWTGGANNNNWNMSGNWDKGKVPTALDNVTIPTVSSSPIISSSISYNTITINSGASFTVNTGATLNTSGDFTNNGTYTDNGGTINFSGTTVQNVNGTVNLKNVIINNSTGVVLNGPTTIGGILTLTNGPLVTNGKLNLILTTGAINYNSSDNGSISGSMMVTKKVPSIKTHYVASPLIGSTSGDFYDDVQVINPSTSLTRLFSWDVPTQAWVGMYGTGTALSPLNGYSIYYPTINASSVLDFTGTYSHKAVYSPVTYSNVTLNGYVLVGNPYPATLDWNNSNGWVKTNIYDGIYFWDAAHGQYASYVNGASTNNGTQYIPSMQAFYVVSSVAGDVTIGVNNSARLTNPNPSMWRYATKSNILKLTLTSGSYSDETVIGFNESADDHFDGSFDAFKLKNPDLVPSIYTTLGNTDYSINTLAIGSDRIIPLNLETGFAGTYTISNEEVAPFHGTYSVILEDKSLNTFTDLKSQNYSFNINPGEGKNRFNLIYKNSESTINNLISDASVVITGDGKEVKVRCNNLINSEANFCIYNSIGQLISTNNFNTTTGTYVYDSSNAVAGVYIVKVIADGKVYSSKVYMNE